VLLTNVKAKCVFLLLNLSSQSKGTETLCNALIEIVFFFTPLLKHTNKVERIPDERKEEEKTLEMNRAIIGCKSK